MATEPRQPDPSKSQHIFVSGKKGTGKTELAFVLFESYPWDRLLIDPNGDVKIDRDNPGDPVVDLVSPVPARWPGEMFDSRDRRQTLVYVPDFGLPDYEDELDRVLGLAFAHGHCCAMVDEAHEAFPNGQLKKRPHARRALRHGRHRDLSMILATPRPMTIDPLCISQADWVYTFKQPNPDDRRRIAENIGWDPKTFDAGVHRLKLHEYLRYDADGDEGEGDLASFPPLPIELIKHHKSAGQVPA